MKLILGKLNFNGYIYLKNKTQFEILILQKLCIYKYENKTLLHLQYIPKI